MPRGELVEQQPLLFPVGEFGPPDGPEGADCGMRWGVP